MLWIGYWSSSTPLTACLAFAANTRFVSTQYGGATRATESAQPLPQSHDAD